MYRAKKLVVVLCVLAISLLASTSVFAADVVWTGQGTTGGSCNTLNYDPTVTQGQQIWQFNLIDPDGSGNYALTATFSTGTYSGTIRKIAGNQVQIIVTTPEGATLLSATATGGTDKSKLTVSHCEVNPPPLQVSKTASTTYTRAYSWTIDKAVDDNSHSGFLGASFTSNYTITVNRSQQDSGWAVSGTITIYNPSAFAATLSSVTDDVSGVAASVNCNGQTSVAPYSTIYCSYSGSLPDGSNRTNTATVTTSGVVPGGVGTAAVVFGDPTTVIGYPSVNVSDSVQGPLGATGGFAQANYARQFQCSSNPADYTNGFYSTTYPNTATITETQQSDSESVTVNCYAPVVSKNASTTFTRTWNWTIDKYPDGEYWQFLGETATHGYSVKVDKVDYTDSDGVVTGSITVQNPNPNEAMSVSLVDNVGGTSATLDCGGTLNVPAGGSASCGYSASLPDVVDGINTATVTFNGINFPATASYSFVTPTTVVNDSIDVTDTNGGLGNVSDDYTWEYDKDFTCSSDPDDYTNGSYDITHKNTAEITQTGQQADANVIVHCYAPVASKDAKTDYTRSYTWDIQKTSLVNDLTLSTGQIHTVSYDVTVSVASQTDSGWTVSGSITVQNPNPNAAMSVSLVDNVGGTSATLDCGGTLNVPAGGSASCGYSASLPDGVDGINIAIVRFNGINFRATATYSFGDPTNLVDDCVSVTDDKKGSLGSACANQAPKKFTYTLDIGPYSTCGLYEFKNTATLTTDDTKSTDSDDHVISVDVPCGGCTLTQGYWKTHSDRGPAPYDDGWKLVGPLEEDTLFFNSGKTWYTVFWTPPAGNAFYNLAHQYMAAKLNILNGSATTPAVSLAIASAEALFNAQGVNDVSLTSAERRTALSLASTLDQYNNGLIGPGHCDE